jgi:hypothetical protein
MISNATRYPVLIVGSLLVSTLVMFAVLDRALEHFQAF